MWLRRRKAGVPWAGSSRRRICVPTWTTEKTLTFLFDRGQLKGCIWRVGLCSGVESRRVRLRCWFWSRFEGTFRRLLCRLRRGWREVRGHLRCAECTLCFSGFRGSLFTTWTGGLNQVRSRSDWFSLGKAADLSSSTSPSNESSAHEASHYLSLLE